MRASAEGFLVCLVVIGCAERPAASRAAAQWSGPLGRAVHFTPTTCLQLDPVRSRCTDGDTLRVSTVEFDRASGRVRSVLEITLHDPAVAESVFRSHVAARRAERGPGVDCSPQHVAWTGSSDSVHAALILTVSSSPDTTIRWRWRLIDRQQLAPLDSLYACDRPPVRSR